MAVLPGDLDLIAAPPKKRSAVATYIRRHPTVVIGVTLPVLGEEPVVCRGNGAFEVIGTNDFGGRDWELGGPSDDVAHGVVFG